MVVTTADAERVWYAASRTRLCQRDPEDVLEVMLRKCGAGPDVSPTELWINKGDFDSCIRQMVPSRWIKEEDKQRLSNVLSAIFHAFEHHPAEEGVCLAEIVGGISLLCAGNKSSKLAFSFQLFAGSNGTLTPELLGDYIGSFATILCACTAEGMDMSATLLRNFVRNAATAAVESIMATLKPGTAEIAFEDVGSWYNTGGFELVPWLELLDLRKWATSSGLEGPTDLDLDQPGSEEAGDSPEMSGNGEGEGEGNGEEYGQREDSLSGELEEGVAFNFSMGPMDGGVVLTITDEDVSNVLELAAGTGLANKDPADVASALISASEETVTGGSVGSGREGYLTKEGFDRCIRSLVPGRRLSQGQKERFSGLLSAVFFAFDFEGSSEVDVLELCSGFSLLCRGNKSAKLACAFHLLDEDKDELLNRKGVWRFLRSVLSILMGFSSACQAKPQRQVVDEVDSVAVWTSAEIFQTTEVRLKNCLSFDELASWYTKGGYRVAPWLELLDLHKWAVGAASQSLELVEEDPNGDGDAGGPGSFANGHQTGLSSSRVGGGAGALESGGGGEDTGSLKKAMHVGDGLPSGSVRGRGGREAEGADAAAGEDGTVSGSPVLFTFPLVPELELVIMQEDVDFVQRVVVGTRLAALLPENVLRTLEERSVAGPKGPEVTKAAFDECMKELVRLEKMSEDERGLLSFALANVFFAYDRQQRGRVLLRDLACGMTFLCCGSKSSKLSLSFSLFDFGPRGLWKEGVGNGGPSEGLSSRRGGGVDVEEEEDKELAALAAAAVRVGAREGEEGEEGEGEGEGEVSGEVPREEVGAFVAGLLTVLCSCVGQMLELTNKEMWVVVDKVSNFALEGIFSDPYSPYNGREGITFEEFGVWYNGGGFKTVPWLELVDLSKWVPGVGALRQVVEGGAEADTGNKARFCFQISESNNPVHLVISDEDAMAVLDLVTKTGLCKREPRDVCGMLVKASKDNVLTKASFDECIRGMVPASLLGTKEKTSFSVLLSSIFFSFDRDNSSCADAVELASGFSLLCAGSKSAKLAFAFGLHDEDGDERLTRRGLWRYTRSFLTALMALSFASSSLSADELTRAVDDGAVWTSAAIFADTITQMPNRIGFDEFAAWYTKGGFRVSPWLELLDLEKWVVPGTSEADPSE